jgi:hypothetical protein
MPATPRDGHPSERPKNRDEDGKETRNDVNEVGNICG